jgi:hypothetical protein
LDIAATLGAVGAAVSAAAMGASVAATSEVSKRLISRIFKRDEIPSKNVFVHASASGVEIAGSNRPRFKLAKRQVFVRMEEARTLLARKEGSAKASLWSARCLTFGQYVIGGVLASSFVQQKTSPQIIGVLGILVLLASLITQHYHPEVAAKVASQKADQLKDLLRRSEDCLVGFEATMDEDLDDPTPLLELLRTITSELSRITSEQSSTTPAPARRQNKG